MSNNSKLLLIVNFAMPLLMCQLMVNAQSTSSSIQEVRDQFTRQVANVYQEKVFVHLDKGSYITGETIWLSSYCVDAAFHTPSGLSRVLNIELLDKSGQAVKQIRIQSDQGFGKGQIFVSPDIQSGTYLLRAYTNWMKNFNPEFVFQGQIEIVNPATVRNLETDVPGDTIFLEFFPEGGRLIAGLKVKVAIKATDGLGNGFPLTGIIYDNLDNEVADFSASELGYASFFITPDADKSYFAKIKRDSSIQTYSLPSVAISGLALTCKVSEVGDLTINIDHTSDIVEDPYLVVHSRGLINKLRVVDLSSEKSIEVKGAELPDGITHITVLDNAFKPLGERLAFKYPDLTESLNLKMTKNEFSKRELVNLVLESDRLATIDAANLSVSVSRANSTTRAVENIVSNLLLTSDLRGSIPDPWVLFDPNNKSRFEQMDLIMLSNGWRRFDWQQVASDEPIPIKYPAEINAPILSGQISPNEKGDLPNSLQMTFLGKASEMNSLDLDTEGYFHFEVPSRVSNDMVYFFINRDTLQANQVSVLSPFDLTTDSNYRLADKFKPESRNYLETLNRNIQISQVYREYNHINGQLTASAQVDAPFYGAPDFLYNLDEYTRFETVEDLFIEYIRSAYIRDNDKRRGFYVYNDGFLPGNALTLIDGVPIFDMEYILNYDPLLVEKVGVVNSLYSMGGVDYHGLIEFTTYKGHFDQQELPVYLVEKAYHALQAPREFYAPDYSANLEFSQRIPDFRNTLYWNPSVEMSGDQNVALNWYTSDDIGTYIIQINGITNQGKPLFLQSSFVVK